MTSFAPDAGDRSAMLAGLLARTALADGSGKVILPHFRKAISVENKAAGFTHGFLVTFRDEKGREVYLPHPAHQEFVKLVGPRIENVLVFDYWTGR